MAVILANPVMIKAYSPAFPATASLSPTAPRWRRSIRGQVFDPSPGRDPRAVHPGLYIADASIIPGALGNNPLLTITALAERVAHLIVREPANSGFFDPARAISIG